MKNNVEMLIRSRRSIRTYENKALSDTEKEEIMTYATTITTPFNRQVTFHMLSLDETPENSKLGTYGVIKGARDYIGITVENKEFALEAVGYAMEDLVLYLTERSLGTCWLGGTFNRKEFSRALSVKEQDLFPIISPVGIPAGKKSATDSLVRLIAGSSKRLEPDKLFFEKDFSNPVSETFYASYRPLFESVRFAPSASNKQPWRILYKNGNWHFYLCTTPGYNDKMPYVIQKVDLGIAACHFDLVQKEMGLDLNFSLNEDPESKLPPNFSYEFSFIKNR